MTELREQIARIITPYNDRIDICRTIADRILALIKENNYVRLSDDQSLPEIHNSNMYTETMRMTGRAMLKANFRRVELNETKKD